MQGGGVFIAISNDILSTPVHELQTDCEIVWAKISLVGRKDRSIHVSVPMTIAGFVLSMRFLTSPCLDLMDWTFIVSNLSGTLDEFAFCFYL
jgi:hypothetical protein